MYISSAPEYSIVPIDGHARQSMESRCKLSAIAIKRGWPSAPAIMLRYEAQIVNDDITPYDFVIGVLIRFFKLNAGDAEAITLTAPNSGITLVAVLPLSDAQAKVCRAHFAASLEGYPLTFTIEAE